MAAVLQRPKDGTYTFASQPRAVKQRKKYRDPIQQDESDTFCYGNIMYDRRVVRGNTYAQHTLPAHVQPDPIEIQRQQEMKRRVIARRRAKDQLRPKSPDPVEGRQHIHIQTELYLEELSDRVEEADVQCQTDAFLDRPPSPLFIPAKTGVDTETQILEGHLFDFDIEVRPILEVIVGKTVEQSLLEVMEQEELANLRQQQRAFEELRNAELIEQQRLEEQERRHREEKERRMAQQREVVRLEKEEAEKIAARAFAQSYLADLVPSIFGTLADNGYFYDPVERDVEQHFLPWLMDEVEDQLEHNELGRLVLDGTLREVVTRRMELHSKLDDLFSSKHLGARLTNISQDGKDVSEPAVIGSLSEQIKAAETEVSDTVELKEEITEPTSDPQAPFTTETNGVTEDESELVGQAEDHDAD